MTVRISTAGQHYRSLTALLNAQSQLARTQQQVATGKRVLTPADDPVGATRIQDLSRQLSASDQYLRNNDVARSRLELEEQALGDVSTAITRIRELVVQASSDTVDYESRQMIRLEIEGRAQELLDIANRKDAQGEYLFSGLATQTQPFARVAGVISYFGDQAQRSQQVGETQRVADGDAGSEVFGRIDEANGTFVTGAAGGNTGSGSISIGNLVDRAAWTGAPYEVQFTSVTTWQVVDTAVPTPNVIASGAYRSGESLVFEGISLAISGAPAAGDTFTVRPSASTDLFSSLDELVGTLASRTDTPATRAQWRTALDGSLAQLDQSLDRMLEVRASVGVRLNTLDVAQTAQEDAALNFETLLSDVRDLDYAEAISRLNVQYTGLQAAQKAIANVGQLSLFDYL
jgi:flagellar hook-associated protein 3 FlgL